VRECHQLLAEMAWAPGGAYDEDDDDEDADEMTFEQQRLVERECRYMSYYDG